MRIPDQLIKSVSFVSRGERDLDGAVKPLQFGGTAFIVGVRMDATVGLAHLVTATGIALCLNQEEDLD